jgi:hypothetical protein
MATNNTNNISYLNKSFDDFKGTLQDYAKTYFPTSYNDYSETSIGLMFIEMASYIGDNLSFYLDTQFQENLLNYAKEKNNLVNIAYSLGYRPKMSYASSTLLDVYQLVPNKTSGSVLVPDYDYAIKIPANSSVKSINNVNFITTDVVDFAVELDREATYYNSSYFLLKKQIKAISANIKTTTYTFGSPEKFTSVNISDDNILQILNVTDSSTNTWYEVPYLAQSVIENKTTNTSADSGSVPYILGYKQVPQRFVSRFINDTTLQLQFGAGTSNSSDSTILPDPDNTQLGKIPYIFNSNFNRANVYIAREYGLAPSNTTLTVTYLVGGGIGSNQPANTITQKGFTVSNITFNNFVYSSNPTLGDTLFNSLSFNNAQPSLGGRDGDTVEEIRQNTLGAFSAQDRVVTKNDYTNRVLSMPSDYGTISKAYVDNSNQKLSDDTINYSALDLYVLSYNANKNITQASSTLKTNLVTYLGNYRMLTDAINIKNAFYINIGINFDITTTPQSSNREALNACIDALKNFFSIDKWQVNQPIVLADIYSTLLQLKQVQAVHKVEIYNLQGGDYSPYGYDITGATRNNIIYPSLDPSIFEVRFPDNDIKGRVITI